MKAKEKRIIEKKRENSLDWKGGTFCIISSYDFYIVLY
jgi:hypothetical protein